MMQNTMQGAAQTNSAMSRRGFVAAGAAALAASGILGVNAGAATKAFAAEATQVGVPEAWDFEADVVCVGGGAAGLACACEAHELDMEAIVLESQSFVGGNSALCNGGIAIPGSPLQEKLGITDSVDKMYEDLCAWFKTDYDDAYVRRMCELAGDGFYEYLTDYLGIEFDESGLLQSNGHSQPREHHVGPGKVVTALENKATELGVRIDFNTCATRIIRDPESGRVLGMQANDADGNVVYYKAKKAVCLATGGYGRNVDMLAEWNFGPAVYEMKDFNSAPGILGQGHIMAMAIGAQPRHLSYCGMLTVKNPDGGALAECAMYHQGGIMVNLEGKRFVNEGQGYTNTWSELLQQTDNVCFQVWDDAIAQKCAENESGYYSQSKVESTGLLLSADTYEELADLMGVPAEAFAATMEAYNSDVAEDGRDSEFGREHISGTGDAPFALDTPPYYAFKTTSVVSSTYGGIKRSSENLLEAEDVFGNTIDGLYLAGNISDFCNMGIVAGTRRPINASGLSFGGTMYFGRACAQDIATRENWDA